MGKYQIALEYNLMRQGQYMCFQTLCSHGLHFCHPQRQTCVACSDYRQDCLTNYQQQNCTQYCMAQWTEEYKAELVAPDSDQRRNSTPSIQVQNVSTEMYSELLEMSNQGTSPCTTYFSIVMFILVLILLLLVIVYGKKIRQIFLATWGNIHKKIQTFSCVKKKGHPRNAADGVSIELLEEGNDNNNPHASIPTSETMDTVHENQQLDTIPIGHVNQAETDSVTHVKQLATQVNQPATQVNQPATRVKQPATRLQQPATNVKQPAMHGKQPATNGRQQVTSYVPLSSIIYDDTRSDNSPGIKRQQHKNIQHTVDNCGGREDNVHNGVPGATPQPHQTTDSRATKTANSEIPPQRPGTIQSRLGRDYPSTPGPELSMPLARQEKH